MNRGLYFQEEYLKKKCIIIEDIFQLFIEYVWETARFFPYTRPFFHMTAIL